MGLRVPVGSSAICPRFFVCLFRDGWLRMDFRECAFIHKVLMCPVEKPFGCARGTYRITDSGCVVLRRVQTPMRLCNRWRKMPSGIAEGSRQWIANKLFVIAGEHNSVEALTIYNQSAHTHKCAYARK